MARARGASQVIAVDMKPARLEAAREMGATHVINAAETDVVAAIRDLTDGIGVDAAIESAGAAAAWHDAAKAARRGGRVLWFGGLPSGTSVEVDSYDVHYGELTFYGVYHCTPRDVATAFELITSGVVDTQALVTRETSLAGVEEALIDMREGRAIKVAIIPGQD